jgi:hypothetical protein
MKQAPGQSPSDANAALADLDGDGLPDLLVGAASRFRSYVNRDGTTWDPPVDWGSASPSVSLSANGVQLADVDADGAADLVVKSGTDTFRYFPSASPGFPSKIRTCALRTWTAIVERTSSSRPKRASRSATT